MEKEAKALKGLPRKKRFASNSVWAKIRKELDLTQTEMADKINCTQPWLHQVESGKSVPSILFVVKFCKELNVDIHEIRRYYEARENFTQRPLSN